MTSSIPQAIKVNAIQFFEDPQRCKRSEPTRRGDTPQPGAAMTLGGPAMGGRPGGMAGDEFGGGGGFPGGFAGNVPTPGGPITVDEATIFQDRVGLGEDVATIGKSRSLQSSNSIPPSGPSRRRSECRRRGARGRGTRGAA